MWLVSIPVVLILFFLIFAKLWPRQFGFLWPFPPAHIHVGPPHIPNCVPNDVTSGPNDFDLHDSWARPISAHKIQHYEWLGKCVSEEVVAKNHDDHDDGLVKILFQSSNEWQPNEWFQISAVVSTSWQWHQNRFTKGDAKLAIFIDWNNNQEFEHGELVETWVGNPPFGGVDPNVTLVTSPKITVPSDYSRPGVHPNIRLRLTYEENNPNPSMSPGGYAKYGEVEDYGGKGDEPVL